MVDERRLTISSSGRLQPDEVGRRTFSVARRGFEQTEVRLFLEQVAREMVVTTEREQELRALLTDAERRAANPVLDEETLTAALGQGTARVLRSAHDAATEVLERAGEDAARMVNHAQEEAGSLIARAEEQATERSSHIRSAAEQAQKRAQEEAASMLEAAKGETEKLLEQTRADCRAMLSEAQQIRARVLGDLTRRRRVLHSQIEQLRAGRERLAQTISGVREAVERVTDDLFRAEDDARLAAEAAAKHLAHQPDTNADALLAESAAAEPISTPASEPAMAGAAASPGPVSTEPPAPEPAAAEFAAVGASPGEPLATVGPASVAKRAETKPAAPPAAPKPAAAKPADTRTADTRPTDTRPTDTRPTDTRPTDTRPAAPKPAAAPAAQAAPKPAAVRPADTKPAAPKPATAAPKPATKPAEAKRVEAKPAEAERVGAPGRGESAAGNPAAAARPDREVARDTVDDGVATEFAGQGASADVQEVGAASAEAEPEAHSREHAVEELFARLRAERGSEQEPEHEVAQVGQASAERRPASSGTSTAGGSGRSKRDSDHRGRALLVGAPDRETAGHEADERGAQSGEIAEAPEAPSSPRPSGVLGSFEASANGGGENGGGDNGGGENGEGGGEPVGDPLISRRDEVLTPVMAALSRRLKRALTDDQNEILDRLRANKAGGAALLVPEEDHLQRYARAGLDQLAEAARGGATFAGGRADESPGVEDLAADLAAAIVTPLRRRLEGENVAPETADDAFWIEHVGAAFRDWKGARIERLAGDEAVAAFSRAALGATDKKASLRWIVDDDGPECPDCDDNALAGPVPHGATFPTGHPHPPAHAGCRCLLAPPGA